jgi:DNA-directed RNA polymerase specialized sigma24 family protein
LFHQHHESLVRALYLGTDDRHEADDLAQEAFVRMFEPDGLRREGL